MMLKHERVGGLASETRADLLPSKALRAFERSLPSVNTGIENPVKNFCYTPIIMGTMIRSFLPTTTDSVKSSPAIDVRK